MFSRFASRRPSSRRRPQAATLLGLESLEDRLPLATTVELDASFNLVITGDNAANNVIVEQRGTDNSLAYVWVNGKAVNKGKAFKVDGGAIIVDLQGGNDTLTVRAQKGKGFLEGATDYQIDLGAGNDTFTFAPNSMTFTDALFSQFDMGTGNDKATFTPGAMNAGSLKFGQVLGGDGNDQFVLTFTTTRNYTSIGIDGAGVIDLGAGDDRFALAWTTFTDAAVDFRGAAYDVGVDLGLGSDKLELLKGAVTRGTLELAVDLGDSKATTSNETGVADGVNSATIWGEGIVSEGATVAYEIYGGSGRDSIQFDDDRIFYSDTLVTAKIDTGAGNDVVSFEFDSNRKLFEGIGTAAASNAAMEIDVALGEGDDKFTETFNPTYWRLQNGAKLTTKVTGNAGNDEIWVNKSTAALLNLDGTFDLQIGAGAGDDLVDVNLGNVLRIGEGYFLIDVKGAGGKDVVNVTVAYDFTSRKNAVYDKDSAVINVDTGDAVDKVWLSVKNNSPNLTIYVNATGGGQTGDTLAKQFTGDVKDKLTGFDGLPTTPNPNPNPNPNPTPGTNPTSSSTTTTPTATGAVATTTVVTTSATETIITTVNTSYNKTTGETQTATSTVVVPLTGNTPPSSSTSATTLSTTTPTGRVTTTIVTTILPTEIKTTTVTTTTTDSTGTAVTTSSTSSTPRT